MSFQDYISKFVYFSQFVTFSITCKYSASCLKLRTSYSSPSLRIMVGFGYALVTLGSYNSLANIAELAAF